MQRLQQDNVKEKKPVFQICILLNGTNVRSDCRRTGYHAKRVWELLMGRQEPLTIWQKAQYLDEIKTCHVFCLLPLPNVFSLVFPPIQYTKRQLLQEAFILNKSQSWGKSHFLLFLFASCCRWDPLLYLLASSRVRYVLSRSATQVELMVLPDKFTSNWWMSSWRVICHWVKPAMP